MRSSMGFLLAAMLATACSSSSSTSEPDRCPIRKGTYTMAFKTRGGDCGDVSESVLNVDQPADAPGKTIPSDAPCVGQFVNSADNCETTMDETCPTTDGGKTKTAGKLTFDENAASGTGIVGITLSAPNGDVVCNGTYDAIVTRQ